MTDIIIAIIVVTAIGLIFGAVLALASHFMQVEEDETEANVREVLPGVNCGACGYAGCDDYAKAIVQDGAKTNLCIPGADAVSQEISNILGIEFVDVEEMVAFVHCNGNLDVTGPKALYDGQMTCRAANMLYAGPGKCSFSCLGCGDCARACPTNAICIKDGVARVNPRICIGCGLCVRDCPKQIISLIPQVAKIAVMCSNKDTGAAAMKACKNACIACKKCEKICPNGAVKVENNLSKIDYKLCTSCGACVEVCPTKCIHRLEGVSQ